jgi:hypothetical protein
VPDSPCLLYCHCAFAKVVPDATRSAVLERLAEAGVAFEAVPDLCEMAARKDPTLKRLSKAPGLKIAACYPRAVRWLFKGAEAPLADDAEILNMRTEAADDVAEQLLAESCTTRFLARRTADDVAEQPLAESAP